MDSDTMAKFDGWWDSVVRPTSEPPPILYHYCSVDAFIKIVTSKTIWLTNLFFMNDSQEHFWLRTKARKCLDEQIRGNPDDFGYEYLDTILKQEWMHEIYCACFSERGDLLSQWRAYADDGKGVSVGFSTSHLQRVCESLEGHLCNVIYDDDTQDTLVRAALDLPEAQGDVLTAEQASFTLLERISEAASRCKSEAFAEEAEWRMVCEPHIAFDECEPSVWCRAQTPRFRDRNGIITPFMEVPLVEGRGYTKRGMEPIKEVTLGPRTSPKLQEYAASLLLKQGNFRRVRVVPSSVSYR